MKELYYPLDLAVAAWVPLLLHALYFAGRARGELLRWFWIGAAVGLTWEVPIFVGSAATEGYRTIAWITPLPLHWSVFMVAHTLWDGGRYVLGCLILRGLFGPGALSRRRGAELAVFVLYGQVQAIVVELSSLFNDGWAFLDLWWNPAVATVNGHNLTLMQHVFWLWGAVAFWLIITREPAGARSG